jgi:hypothetical protein
LVGNFTLTNPYFERRRIEMTYEAFEKARRIDYDVKLLSNISIPAGMSNSTMAALQKWIDEYTEKLENEFDEL